MVLDFIKKLSFGKKIASFAVSLYLLPVRIIKGNRVKFGKNFICKWDLKIKGPGTVIFGDNINAWTNAERNIIETFDKNAKVVIGNNTRLNGSWIQARKSILIGENCVLGSTTIIDTEFHALPNKTEIPSKEIEIGNNIWIGGRSGILKGVKIGDNSVVGFGTVVRTDIPSNSVAIGNPSQIVKKLQ